MRRRELLALATGTLIIHPVGGSAQPAKMPVIGVLVPGSQADSGVRLFRERMHDLGYVEGRNIRIEIRSAQDDTGRLPALAAELAREKVDIIAPWSTPAALAAKRATSDIPIVMLASGDPVASGIVTSLPHPGGNITGMGSFGAETSGKQVQFLRAALPKLHCVGALLNAADPYSAQHWQQIQLAGKAQGIEVALFRVKAGPELEGAFPAMVNGKIEAIIIEPTLPIKLAADLAILHRLPAAAAVSNFTSLGGLLAYSLEPNDFFRSAAVLVDKVLKGVKPADLPVQRPMRFRLSLNMKTAKALGLTLPPTLLAQADEVIE